jgi:arsenate reductase
MAVPRVLFVCVGNSCRSQMAEGYARELGAGRVEASSAGTAPAAKVSSGALRAMAEAGIDISGGRPEPIDYDSAGDYDLVILMGPEVELMCPKSHFPRRESWGIADPYGGGDDDYRRARDEIRRKVEGLLLRMGPGSGPA